MSDRSRSTVHARLEDGRSHRVCGGRSMDDRHGSENSLWPCHSWDDCAVALLTVESA